MDIKVDNKNISFFTETEEKLEESDISLQEQLSEPTSSLDNEIFPSVTFDRIQNRKKRKERNSSFNPMKVQAKKAKLEVKEDKFIDPTYNINALNVSLQMWYDEITAEKIAKLSKKEEDVCKSIKISDFLIGQFNKYRSDVKDGKTISLDHYNEDIEGFKNIFKKVSGNDKNSYNPFPEGVNLEKVDEEMLIGFINDLSQSVESKQFDLTTMSRDLKTAIEFHLQFTQISSARVGRETDIDRMIRGQTTSGG